MSIFSRLFKPKVPPQEQLVIDVVEELKRRGIEGGSYNHQEYTLTIGDVTLGLTNLFLEWRLRDRPGKAQLIKRHLDGALTKPVELPGFDEAAANLLPLVRSRHDISLTRLQGQCDGAPAPEGLDFAWQPLVGDLAIMVGWDYPDGIRRISRSDLKRFGVAWETMFERALKNLRERAPAFDFESDAAMPGVLYLGSAEDYQSSMLLLPERMPRLPDGSGDLIAMVPGRNSMWITGSRNGAGLAALLDFADQSMASVPHPCSTMLFRLEAGQWTVFIPDDDGLRSKHRLLQLKQTAVNYEQQKAALDRMHEVRNEDVFVSQLLTVSSVDDLRSLTVWPSGSTDTLLPCAENIVFGEQLIDPKSGAVGMKRTIEVAWDQALPRIKDLMEEVPDVYPPRYRVRHFPDAETLAVLEQHGTRLK